MITFCTILILTLSTHHACAAGREDINPQAEQQAFISQQLMRSLQCYGANKRYFSVDLQHPSYTMHSHYNLFSDPASSLEDFLGQMEVIFERDIDTVHFFVKGSPLRSTACNLRQIESKSEACTVLLEHNFPLLVERRSAISDSLLLVIQGKLSSMNSQPIDDLRKVYRASPAYRDILRSTFFTFIKTLPNSLTLSMNAYSLPFEDMVEVMPSQLVEQVRGEINGLAQLQRATKKAIIDESPAKYELQVVNVIQAHITHGGGTPLAVELYVPRKALPCVDDNKPMI